MKINISKAELIKALSTVIKATASRPSVPSLSGILITTQEDKITFFASDLETSIKTEVAGLIEDAGKVAVPGKIFTDIIRSLPESAVILETDGEMLHIKASQSNFTIRTINTEDFIKFPDVEGVDSVTLPTVVLNSMVKKVSKSVSKDETRAVLTGILVKIENNTISMVATDSYRLAVIEKEVEGLVQGSFEALIPGRAFDEVVKMASEVDSITISLSSNQVKFVFGDTKFITRRLEGNYPNYKQLLPKEFNTQVMVTHHDLYDAVKRVSLMAINNAAIKLQIGVEDQTLALTAKTQDVGDAEEYVMVKAEGVDGYIAINHAFLLDGLSVMDSEFVSIEIVEPMKPGIIKSTEENFLYLVMPVRSV